MRHGCQYRKKLTKKGIRIRINLFVCFPSPNQSTTSIPEYPHCRFFSSVMDKAALPHSEAACRKVMSSERWPHLAGHGTPSVYVELVLPMGSGGERSTDVIKGSPRSRRSRGRSVPALGSEELLGLELMKPVNL